MSGPAGMATSHAAMRTATPGARNRTASATHAASKEVLSHATATSLLLPARPARHHALQT